eukprot:CAMPEP_0175161734 /NCGR_PEP_ID=MMETSP0087-20121206/24766_1 /TAXON_ID=136419 /ORGANISM="Unknown Unknown, Strain D1" /LENGTH=587 /DNA_ID=CAMNT_0016450175 /DNA_START=48 /DNA_END=1812 /DNA_ORIENTATION=-
MVIDLLGKSTPFGLLKPLGPHYETSRLLRESLPPGIPIHIVQEYWLTNPDNWSLLLSTHGHVLAFFDSDRFPKFEEDYNNEVRHQPYSIAIPGALITHTRLPGKTRFVCQDVLDYFPVDLIAGQYRSKRKAEFSKTVKIEKDDPTVTLLGWSGQHLLLFKQASGIRLGSSNVLGTIEFYSARQDGFCKSGHVLLEYGFDDVGFVQFVELHEQCVTVCVWRGLPQTPPCVTNSGTAWEKKHIFRNGQTGEHGEEKDCKCCKKPHTSAPDAAFFRIPVTDLEIAMREEHKATATVPNETSAKTKSTPTTNTPERCKEIFGDEIKREQSSEDEVDETPQHDQDDITVLARYAQMNQFRRQLSERMAIMPTDQSDQDDEEEDLTKPKKAGDWPIGRFIIKEVQGKKLWYQITGETSGKWVVNQEDNFDDFFNKEHGMRIEEDEKDQNQSTKIHAVKKRQEKREWRFATEEEITLRRQVQLVREIGLPGELIFPEGMQSSVNLQPVVKLEAASPWHIAGVDASAEPWRYFWNYKLLCGDRLLCVQHEDERIYEEDDPRLLDPESREFWVQQGIPGAVLPADNSARAVLGWDH